GKVRLGPGAHRFPALHRDGGPSSTARVSSQSAMKLRPPCRRFATTARSAVTGLAFSPPCTSKPAGHRTRCHIRAFHLSRSHVRYALAGHHLLHLPNPPLVPH